MGKLNCSDPSFNLRSEFLSQGWVSPLSCSFLFTVRLVSCRSQPKRCQVGLDSKQIYKKPWNTHPSYKRLTSCLLQTGANTLNEGRPKTTDFGWLQLPDPPAEKFMLCSRLPRQKTAPLKKSQGGRSYLIYVHLFLINFLDIIETC